MSLQSVLHTMRKLPHRYSFLALSLIAFFSILHNAWDTPHQEEQHPAAAVSITHTAQHPTACSCAAHHAETHCKSKVHTSSRPFIEFKQWLSTWQKADATTQQHLLPKGIKLAHARAAALSQLIEQDPDRALSQILPFTTYAKLPQEVSSLIESPVSQTLQTKVLPSCAGNNEAGIYVTFTDDAVAEEEKSFITSQHSTPLSKTRAPILAYRLKGKSLLAPSSIYQLEAHEISDDGVDYIDPVSGEPVKEHLRAIIAGRTFGFANQQNIDQLRDAFRTAENALSPKSMEYVLDAMTNGEALVPQTIIKNAALAASSWTTGNKSVLMIRVQFADIAATQANSYAHDDSNLQGDLDTRVEAAFSSMSFGKVTMTAEASTAIYTIGSWYGTGGYGELQFPSGSILTDARTQAANAGYNLSNYDIIGVCFPEQSSIAWSGLATTGGSDLWINGNTGDRIITHELGHNYGVRHASLWLVNGSSEPDAASGSFQEYGDMFDAMGSAFSSFDDYNAVYKRELNWLESTNVLTLKSASQGTYRLYSFVDENADLSNNRTFAINAQLGSSPNLWLSYRADSINIAPRNLHNGAQVIWYNSADAGHTRLLDMTPDSQDTDHQDRKDSALEVGKSYTFAGPLKLEVLSKGGTAPHQYIDVKVTLGTPGNTAPQVSSITPTSASAFKPITFSCNATDPDGDTLTYSWDFGDSGGFDTPLTSSTSSDATPSKTYNFGGTFQVSVTVDDGKGGSATHTETVTISDPLANWTKLATGTGNNLHGITFVNNKLILTGDNLLRSSQDGGDSWTTHSLPHSCNLQEAAYFNGAYFIAGSAFINNSWQSVIYRSSDLSTFTNVAPANSTEQLNSLAVGNNSIVAVGNNGTILQSLDGLSWSAKASGTALALHDVAYASGRFIAGGGNDTFSASTQSITGVALQSTDGGSSWTSFNLYSSPSYHTTYSILGHNGEFIAGDSSTGLPYTTNNGSAWGNSHFYATAYITGLAYGQGTYIATGIGLGYNPNGGFRDFQIDNDYLAVSLNGQNWATAASPTGAQTTPLDSTYGHGHFFIVGANGNLWRSGLLSAYEKWTASHLPSGLNDDPTEDPDADSLTNAIEFALGSNPSSPNTNPVQLDLTGAKARISVNKNALAASSFSFQLQRSTNLTTWSTVNTSVISDSSTQLIIESTATIESENHEFYRLVIYPKN